MLLIRIISLLRYCGAWLALMASVYKGYKAILLDSIIGALYGFVDGLVGCYLLAWLYNKL